VIADTGAGASAIPWADCQSLQLDPTQGTPIRMSGLGNSAVTRGARDRAGRHAGGGVEGVAPAHPGQGRFDHRRGTHAERPGPGRGSPGRPYSSNSFTWLSS
jgi:hypothetical protein